MSREPYDRKQTAGSRTRPISRGELWVIRGLMTAAVFLVLVSLGMTIGKDVLQSITRRWEAGHFPVAEINPPQRKELPPPAPDLGLPSPPQVSLLPPPSTRRDTAAVTESSPPEDAPVVVNEPILDGHMLTPEDLETSPEPLSEPEVADAERTVIDELFLDESQQQPIASNRPERAPQVAGLQSASARERIKYASAVKRLLRFVVDGDDADQAEAEKSFSEARRICSDDPRLPLAYGLYLQQIGQHVAARDVWEDSVAAEGRTFLLSHQAAAMSRLMAGDFRRAWPHLLQLAEIVGQPTADDYPTENQRRRTAEWLGATAAFLESLPEDVDGRHLLVVNELRDRLPEAWHAVFETGREESGRQLQELLRWIALPAEDANAHLTAAIAALEDQRQAAATEVDTLQAALREATSDLRGATETEKKARGELNVSSRQRRLIVDAVADLSQPRTYSYTQTTYTTTTDSQGRQQRVPTTVVLRRAENSSERSARLAQLREASAALAKLEAVLSGLKTQHEQAKAARDELVVELRERTAGLRGQLSAALRQHQHTERLCRRLQDLAAKPDEFAERLKSPTFILDWNVEELADRLKATFGPVGKTPVVKSE